MQTTRERVTMLRRLAAALAAVTLFVTVSCSASTVTTDPTTEDSSAQTEPAQNEPAQNDAASEGSDGGELEAGDADTQTGITVVVDPGEEPRVELGPAASTEVTIAVTAEEGIERGIDGASDNDLFSADYDVVINAQALRDSFVVTQQPVVRSLVVDTELPDFDELALTRSVYGARGLAPRTITQADQDVRRLTYGLLVTPNLILAVPAEPVGVGAQWEVPLDADGEAFATTTLLAIDDETVEVSFEFTSSTDQGEFTMTVAGTYDRASLIVRSATARSTLSFATTTIANGEEVEITGAQTSVRVYQEVSS